MQLNLCLLGLMLLALANTGELYAQDEEQPGVDLLEFLGSYQDENGKWIDPAEMENINLPKEQTDEQPTED